MGMSASQSRFLMLTGQKNDVEFQSQQINYQRLILSQQNDQMVKDYTEKTNNRILLFQAVGSDVAETRLTYSSIVAAPPEGMGMRLVNATSGKIMVPEMPNPLFSNTTVDDYFVEPELNNADMLEVNLREGTYQIQKLTDKTDTSGNPIYENISIAGTSQIVDEYNTMDDAAAESEMTYKQTMFQSQDKTLELKIKQLDTQHKALETEMDSIKKVIDKNVETTFKTFG